MICLGLLTLVGCGKKKVEGGSKVVTAEKRIITTRLFYSGVIEPIQVRPFPSPVEGVIKNIYFEYGQRVKKDEMLFTIYSKQLQESYRNTLTTYLNAKRTYLDSVTAFEGTKVLHENKIVSDEEFKNEQSQVIGNRLAYINAIYNLEQAIEDIPGEEAIKFKENIEKLSFDDIAKIEEVLDRKMDIVKVRSPYNGVALPPKKADGESSSKLFEEGSNVKKEENLLSLGDLSGISILIKINEIDINRVKPGQKVDVVTPAIPGEIFKGEIKSISAQAKAEVQSGGLATFPAKVVIKQITKKQHQLVRIGMSAKVSVNIQSKPEIVIPIEAVFEKEGTDRVIVIDPKTKKEKETVIVVGKTNPEGISVISGLKAGDKVLVRD